MRFRASASLLVVLLFLSASSAQRGALVLPRGLDQLTAQSERIVHANVISAKVEPHPQHPNLSTVFVRVRVQETLKGKAVREMSFRQFIWDFRDKRDGAGYRKGQELVLFLNKPTAEGLTSTAGLEQGRLVVERQGDRKAVVRPHTANETYLKGIDKVLRAHRRNIPASISAAQRDASRAIDLDDLKQTVRDLVDVRGGK